MVSWSLDLRPCHAVFSMITRETPTRSQVHGQWSPCPVLRMSLLDYLKHETEAKRGKILPFSICTTCMLRKKKKSFNIITHATSCRGCNVFDPSVSQSVSTSVLFFLSAQLLWNRSTEFSWNFKVVKDIPCRCAYPQEILIQFFFSELRPFWT